MRRIAVLSLVMSASFLLWAQKVSESDALRTAQSFMMQSDAGQVKSHGGFDRQHPVEFTLVKKGLTPKSNTPAYYLFAGKEKGTGFVIVAGDERTSHRILGYSATGNIDADNLPENMKAWLEYYAEQIDAVSENSDVKASGAPDDAPGTVVVEPLVKTEWDQGEPFNNKCTMTSEGRALVGCVGVALGQIMNYHRWPQQTVGKVDYDGKAVWIDEDLSSYTYDYDNLDVAQYLYNVAVAVRTEFGGSASSSTDSRAAKGILRHFKYDHGLRLCQRGDADYTYYTDAQWDSLLRDELDAHRPVYYAANKRVYRSYIGHAFVCDGYDDAGYFHFNWGWGGYCDGWFLTTAMNPGGDYYYNDQVVITHIQPDKGNLYWAEESGEWGSGQIVSFADTVRTALCLEDDSTGVKHYTSDTQDYVMGIEDTRVYVYGPGTGDMKLPDGTYKKYIVWKLSNSEPWRTFTNSNAEAEMFKWIDVTGDNWEESSSRNFDACDADGWWVSLTILSENSARMKVRDGGRMNDIDTKVYLDSATYRGVKYAVTEIDEVVSTTDNDYSSKKVIYPANLRRLVSETSIPHYEFPEHLESVYISKYQGTELDLPASLVSIGSLTGCSQLTTLTIPANVATIGSFRDTPLKSVVFEKNSKLMHLPDYTFSSFNRLSKVELPDHLQTIGKSAFYNCTSLKSLTIPSSVEEIGIDAFYGCANLSELNIAPDASLRVIGEEAFQGCVSMTKITLPDNLQEVNRNAFYNCTNLKDIAYGNSLLLSAIGEYAFCGCTGVTDFSFIEKSQVETIGQYAFRECTNLKSLTLPASLKNTNESFYGTGLEYVDMSRTQMTDISDFSSCESLSTIILPEGLKKITSLYLPQVQSFCIPASVDTVLSINAPMLAQITIPRGLTYYDGVTLAAGANVICERETPGEYIGLTTQKSQWRTSTEDSEVKGNLYATAVRDINVYVPVGATAAYQAYEYLYNRTGRLCQQFVIMSPIYEMASSDSKANIIADENGAIVVSTSDVGGTLEIPSTVTTAQGAVNVTSIAEAAFFGNTTINVVDIPASIGGSAASKTRAGGSTSGIGDKAFAYCQNLETVLIRCKTPVSISANVFEGLDLSEMTLRVPDEALISYRTADVWKDFGTIEGFDPTGIEDVKGDSANNTQDGNIYDLQGRKAVNPQHGIFIQNGKKIVRF